MPNVNIAVCDDDVAMTAAIEDMLYRIENPYDGNIKKDINGHIITKIDSKNHGIGLI